MDLVSISEIILGVLLAAIILPIGWLFARRRWLSREVGSFDCGLRKSSSSRWRLGMARYEGNKLAWYPAFGIWTRPAFVMQRGDWAVVSQRELSASETLDLYADQMVIELRWLRDADHEHIELAIQRDSITGLLSWIESAPPGTASYGLASPQ